MLLFVVIFVFGMAMHEVFPDNFWVATFMSIVGGFFIAVVLGALHIGGF